MESSQQKIWSAALKILELRIHSKKEIREKLLKKFPQNEGDILQVMDEMERVHLISDQRFAEEFVAHLTQKNIGRLKIMHETRLKGLPTRLVEQILLDQNWSEEKAANRAMQEKNRVLDEVDERKKKQKLLSFLRNRGFTERVIYSLLREGWG